MTLMPIAIGTLGEGGGGGSLHRRLGQLMTRIPSPSGNILSLLIND